MTPTINSQADIEALRGTPDFEAALRALHGSMTVWSLTEAGQWEAAEDLSAIERLGYNKASFLAEIAPFNFPSPEPPPAPPQHPPSSDPADYPLTPVQFKAMIEISGWGPDVDAAIAAITDPIDRAVVRSKYLYSTSYRRDNPIIAMLQPAVGITDVELDALWMTAKDLTP